MGEELSIREVAERTGLPAGTIRMWERRHGLPQPRRAASGYRQYTTDDVELLLRALAHRREGLSVAAALARAAEAHAHPSDHPSVFAAVAAAANGGRPQMVSKAVLLALSRAIEDETLARAAAPLLFAAFQRERFFRQAEPRYRRLSERADAAVVFADFPAPAFPEGGPVELPISTGDALGSEWAVIVDAPGLAACLVGWEQPVARGGDGRRDFEMLWTADPRATRRAAETCARIAARADLAYGAKLEALLADRPLALEQPAPALTALTNRMVSYLAG